MCFTINTLSGLRAVEQLRHVNDSAPINLANKDLLAELKLLVDLTNTVTQYVNSVDVFLVEIYYCVLRVKEVNVQILSNGINYLVGELETFGKAF